MNPLREKLDIDLSSGMLLVSVTCRRNWRRQRR
ncbi:hypothetical protein SAMN05421642_102540 [Rhodococcoides kyotonense]|uniref:Uncharacterized protein n=1 Tax=Rhodococcoides kyotonense TaxID=398843 RepID=A0A239ESH3_9NOCA|nr:hypothetical protein SAMN05421642_102540 [Rhodococcus kyotonensis]